MKKDCELESKFLKWRFILARRRRSAASATSSVSHGLGDRSSSATEGHGVSGDL
jgi:hypothetical protein